ncbi:kinase-like domain-containing protein [Protomyces lactucae-debilis]|uniref:non-specific serine/threonine protein kinase n=1 Tax=Protomyces lactucae-debilis TaxID=2754530 RepID=A0A1Y2F369_PROLT|nr:kinase-like domain-containing protein [Protomyces lactucae-debilis]ORY77776.1 kinase-like domain-containing protein [Protomyces lactucae-debilis]
MEPPAHPGQPHKNGEDWADRGASRRVEHTVVNGIKTKVVVKKGVKDFTFGETLGEGSYSTVVLATDRQTLKEYAIKVLDKRHIIKEKKVKYVNIEKNTLFRLGDHPGVVRLYYTFQDEASLYFVLDLATNGELLGVLKKLTTFDEECSRYYTAQILDAIDYMHSKGVIHRDLKPENVLLDDKMRVKIADFGTAKLLDHDGSANGSSTNGSELEGMEQSDRANSFVGTAEYVSPELLTEKSTCKSSDLWALGCILYQLLAGKPPFKANNEYQTFQKIVHLDYTFPPAFPATAADLIRQLLVANPVDRLTVPQIRQHAFFQSVDWSTLWKVKAPKLRPYRPQPGMTIEQQQLAMPQSSVQLPTHSGTRLDFAHQHAHHGSYGAVQSHRAPQHATVNGASTTATTRPRSRIESSPSELDLQFSQILNLPGERILRLGQVNVLSSTSGDVPRKFNKMLSRKKHRTLLVTSTGRCLYIEVSGDSKKVKGEITLSGTTTVTRLADEIGKSFLLETPQKSYLFEDPATRSYDWVESIKEANGRVAARLAHQAGSGPAAAAAAAMANQPPRSSSSNMSGKNLAASAAGTHGVIGNGAEQKQKRRSRIGF